MISKWTFLLLVASFLMPELSNAQYMNNNYGMGMYGAMQACPYKMRAGAGAYDGSDEMKDLIKEAQDKSKELATKKRDLSNAERDMRSAESALKRSLQVEAVRTIIGHYSSGKLCKSYFANPEASKTSGKEGDSAIAPDDEIEPPSFEPFTANEWKNYCPLKRQDSEYDNGRLKDSICENSRLQKSKYATNVPSCKDGLKKYVSSLKARELAKRDLEQLNAEIADLKARYKDAKEQYQEDLQNADQSQTQADYCADCEARGNGYSYEAPKTDWGATLVNVSMGLASMWGNYKTNQMLGEYNSNLGYPTQQNYIGYMPGLASVVGGIYGGITGGSGQGAFGCNPGINGNGNWNVQGMNSPFFQGGLYYPGQGNMWGYPANYYQNPLANMFAQGSAPWMVGPNGGMQGYPNNGGYGANGNFTPGINPYGQGGYQPGMGNFISAGGFANGMIPGNGAYSAYPGMGAYQGGMPGMGNFISAGAAVNGMMPGNGSYSAYPGMGAYQSGMPGMGNFISAGAAVNGMMPGMGAYSAGSYMPGMGNYMQGSAGVDLGAAQYQQQMLQMQLQAQQQQAQMYLQQQQQAAAQYQQNLQLQIQKQQAAAEVQMQIQQLSIKLQQIQAGVGFSGSGYLSGGISGGLTGGGTSTGLNFGVGSVSGTNGTTYNPVINPNGTNGVGTRGTR